MEDIGRTARYTDELVFFVNGRKIKERRVQPTMVLLTYLRDELNLKGAKLSCGEGGCGSCTVMLSRLDPATKKIRHDCVYACLVPICSVHGTAVTTIEGLGSVRDRLHPIQECLIRNHGTQCGFCTPGMVMTMYTLLRNNPTPTKEEIEKSLGGVICRCTGYAPILNGFYTLCERNDCCGKSGFQSCPQNCLRSSGEDNPTIEANGTAHSSLTNNNPVWDPSMSNSEEKTPTSATDSQELIFPPELLVDQSHNVQFLKVSGNGLTWYRPTTLKMLLHLRLACPDAVIVAGYNDIGLGNLLKDTVNSDMISITHVPEMNTISKTSQVLAVGGAVTFSRLMENVEQTTANVSELQRSDTILPGSIAPQVEGRLLTALVEVLRTIGGVHTSNTATLGGHIMSASKQSDVIPLLISARCHVTVVGQNGERQEELLEFLNCREPRLKCDEILLYIHLPLSTKNQYFRGYRTDIPHRRPMNDDVMNAGLTVTFDGPEHTVEDFTACFGGVADKPFILDEIRSMSKGRTWNDDLFRDVLAEVDRVELSPYKLTMLKSFLVRFYIAVAEERKIDDTGMKTESSNRSVYVGGIISGTQERQCQLYGGVGDSLEHVSSIQQATGEAVYLDDIPPRSDELAVFLVTSDKAHAKIKYVDATDALALEGVVCLIDARDIRGRNVACQKQPDEEIFATNEVNCVGQAIAAVVAKTKEIAKQAAKLVKIEYHELSAILTIEEAIEKDSFFRPLQEIHHGASLDHGFASSDDVMEGEVRLGGQEHFYMETHRCIAIPDSGDQSLHVMSSTQHPTNDQKTICMALGLPDHKVKVTTTRIGGGYGGKDTRPALFSAICAVAAYKTRKPVRCVLDREVDMKICGGRQPVLARYKVGFSKSGRLRALDVDMFMNAGHSEDRSLDILAAGMHHVTNVYSVPDLKIKGYACKTNLPSNTAMRGFGRPQGMMIAEFIISKVAARCGLPECKVREINFLSENEVALGGQRIDRRIIKACWEECTKKSDFQKRWQNIKEFNRTNKWRKRGISLVPTRLGIGLDRPAMLQAGALVNVYTDGSVLLTHGGIEMGQGLHTKMIQIASTVLDVPVDRIRISDTCTASVPNTTCTSGSLSTDLNGMAVKDACEKIKQRLQKFKENNPDHTWEDLVKSAYLNLVSLSATGYYGDEEFRVNATAKDSDPFIYSSYGAACSEVEIDCLTGEHHVICTYIVMDVGRSINPAIDIGQIQGAFLQGYGLFMTEELLWSDKGELLTSGPGMYKLPRVQNIPREFNIHLLENSKNPKAIFSSKGVGEPPLFLAASIFFAVKEAIRSARKDSGLKEDDFQLDCPATAKRVRMACGNHFNLTT